MDLRSQDGSGPGSGPHSGSGSLDSEAPHSAEGSRFGGLLLFGSKRKQEQPDLPAEDFGRRLSAVDSQEDLAESISPIATSSVDTAATEESVSAAIVWTSTDSQPRFAGEDAFSGNSTSALDASTRPLEPSFAQEPPLATLAEDFERRGRKSATISRLLEQHRRHLLTAQNERAELYEKLERIVPVVQQTADSLREAMNGRMFEAEAPRLQELFDVNERALNELGTLATALTADFLWLRSAWGQYTQTVKEAQTLR